MYLKQRLTLRWNSATSHYFNVRNDVKQGGAISHTLFCVYMDGLLNELQQSGVGCHMEKVFSGAFAYADDIILYCIVLYCIVLYIYFPETVQ